MHNHLVLSGPHNGHRPEARLVLLEALTACFGAVRLGIGGQKPWRGCIEADGPQDQILYPSAS